MPAVGAAAARQCPRRAAEQNLVVEAAAATRVAVAWGVIRGGATRGPRQGDSLCDHRTPPPPSWSSCATPPPADARLSSEAYGLFASGHDGRGRNTTGTRTGAESKGYPKGASRQQEDHQVRVGGAKTVQHPRGGGAANGCLHLRGGSAVDRGRPSRNAKIESESVVAVGR